jgi:hypothetical protein
LPMARRPSVPLALLTFYHRMPGEGPSRRARVVIEAPSAPRPDRLLCDNVEVATACRLMSLSGIHSQNRTIRLSML